MLLHLTVKSAAARQSDHWLTLCVTPHLLDAGLQPAPVLRQQHLQYELIKEAKLWRASYTRDWTEMLASGESAKRLDSGFLKSALRL